MDTEQQLLNVLKKVSLSRRSVFKGALIATGLNLIPRQLLADLPPVEQPEEFDIQKLIDNSRKFGIEFNGIDEENKEIKHEEIGKFISATGNTIIGKMNAYPFSEIEIPRFVYTQYLLRAPFSEFRFEGDNSPKIDSIPSFQFMNKQNDYIQIEPGVFELAEFSTTNEPASGTEDLDMESIDQFLKPEDYVMCEYTAQISKFIKSVYDPELAKTGTADGIFSKVDQFDYFGDAVELYNGLTTSTQYIEHAIMTLGSMTKIGAKNIIQMMPGSIAELFNDLDRRTTEGEEIEPYTINLPFSIGEPGRLQSVSNALNNTGLDTTSRKIVLSTGNEGKELDLPDAIPQGIFAVMSLDKQLNIDTGSGSIPVEKANGRYYAFPEKIQSLSIVPQLSNVDGNIDISLRAKKVEVSGASFASSQFAVTLSAIESAMQRQGEQVNLQSLEIVLDEVSDIREFEIDSKKYEVKIINPEKLFKRFNIGPKETEKLPEKYENHLPFIGA